MKVEFYTTTDKKLSIHTECIDDENIVVIETNKEDNDIPLRKEDIKQIIRVLNFLGQEML